MSLVLMSSKNILEKSQKPVCISCRRTELAWPPRQPQPSAVLRVREPVCGGWPGRDRGGRCAPCRWPRFFWNRFGPQQKLVL